MTKHFSAPRGTKDLLPSEIFLWRDVETKARQILSDYNYKEIRTPIFEETSLFKRSLGQTSEVVNKQLLELVSNKGEEEGFALRPEGTAPIVRAYIENGLDRQEGITKLFYIGPMFRGERPQKGRLRQFHQIGVEVLGADTSNPYLDAEVIALNVNILKALGLNNFKLKINTLGSLQDTENLSSHLRGLLQSKKSGLCEDCQDRFERNVFRILDCKNQLCREMVGSLHLGYDHLAPESSLYFSKVKNALGDLGIAFEAVPHLVRGLDYYTHTVFEICDSSLGSQDALSAGGRYGSLVSQLGGPQTDAVGFALGIERVLLAMPSGNHESLERLEVYILALDENVFPKAFQILNQLRSAGISTDISYKVSSIKSQMRSAHKAGARHVIILGEDEHKKGVVSLKDMEGGGQREVDWNHLMEVFQK